MAAEPGLGSPEGQLILAASRIDCGGEGALDGGMNSQSATDRSNCCRQCGACCAYSASWPRFSVESDDALALIPGRFVNERMSGMRCRDDRCAALEGKIGVAASCAIYAVRPEVCRTCMPGDAECAMARRKFGLPAI